MNIDKDIIYGVLELNNKVSYGVKNEKRFYPYDKNLPMFYVPTKKPFSTTNIYCGIRFDKQTNDKYFGVVEKYIGNLGVLENELEYLKNIATNGWKGNSKFTLNEYFDDITPVRKDLTYLKTYSIDPNGCIDIDDAISIEKMEDSCKIYIHIADVTSFILPNTVLDLEIRKRKESVYLTKSQINMIPDKLSIEKISLKSDRINRAFTLELTLNKDYDIIAHTFYKSNIQVKNLSYEYAQTLIDKSKNEDLTMLFDISKELYKFKFGDISNFDTHHMVEIFMIIANVYAAKEIVDYDGAIFRKQNKKYQEISFKNNLLSNLFIDINPASYTNYIDSNKAHDSIREEFYTHFTSPMRRYIDIIVHRILSNKYCNTNFEINYDNEHNNTFIDELNSTHKNLKRINFTAELYNHIFKPDFKEYDIYEGVIIGFSFNKLRVYINKIGIINIKLFSKQFEELFEYEIINDEIYRFYDKINDKHMTFLLNQNIKVNMSVTKLGIQKLNTSLFIE